MNEILKTVIEENKGLLFENTSMILDVICENLFYKHNIDAVWQGRSIYVNHKRVASISVSKEGKNIVGIYDYKLLA